ncbi:MAG: S41 family peptidase [Pyrinomonadaceae bacterium]
MTFRGKISVLVLSGVLAIYAVVGGMLSPWTQAQQPINDSTAQMRIFESVLQHIQNDYVDEPNLEKVRYGALRGLVGGLDPYSSYLTPEQVKEFGSKQPSNKVGIGAQLSQVALYLYVVSVSKGSNAEKAGLKAGDVVEYVENKATRDISLYDAKQLVLGDPGTSVSLRILRASEKPQTIKVVRGEPKVPAVESKMEAGKIGLIKVFSLESGEANDIKTHIQNLTKQGAEKIVLDLRSVATGTLEEGVAAANLFIKNGDLAKVIGKDGVVKRTFSADPTKAVFDGKLAVLIDLGTAGAAEAIAAAVLDAKRGEVVGERTFGAGTEQQLFTLRGGDGLLLTTAKWASPSGKPFLGDDRATTGIKPSVEVKRPDTPAPLELNELIDQQEEQKQNPDVTPTPLPVKPVSKPSVLEDLQLKKALEILQEKAQAAKVG